MAFFLEVKWPQGTGSLGDSHSCLSPPASSLTPLLPARQATVYPVLHALPPATRDLREGALLPILPAAAPGQGLPAWGESLSQRGKKKEEEREGERDAHLSSYYIAC